MKKLIFYTLLSCLPFLLTAQQDTEVGLMIGGANYQGDLASDKTYSFDEVNLGGGLYVRHHLNRKFSIRGSFFYTKLEGADRNFADEAPFRAARDFEFFAPTYEFSLTPEWHFLGNTIKRKKLRPYLFAGIGAIFTNPKSNLSEKDVNAVELEPGHFPTSHFSFPLGLGFNFDLNEKVTLGLEASSHFPFTDYLDGISESANPDKNDWFAFGGITIGYKFGESIPLVVDTDGDGINDDVDLCPLIVGDIQGCPDSDSDGIVDIKDECPKIAGDKAFNGCPDSDSDGIADNKDDCPNAAGMSTLGGCPDSDLDGIVDNDDSCPALAGTLANNGCPEDADKDGIYDIADDCPNIAGTINGCPDSDKDGIADRNDNCPNIAGIANFNGCPDTDGDGIADADDNCPNSKGVASNNGCPEADVFVSRGEVITTTTTSTTTVVSSPSSNLYLVDDVYFANTNVDIDNDEKYKLDQVARLLKENPNYNLKIIGHTDNKGNLSMNDHLSMRRARRCYKYLASKGIKLSRMSFEGSGASEPKHENSTEEGKKLNRRVEFIFIQ